MFWLSDSFTTICSQLKRALLRAPIHRSSSISPHWFLSAVPFQSFYQPGDPAVLALSMTHCSLPSVYFYQSPSTVSSQPYVSQGLENQLDRQVQCSIYLSFNLCQSTLSDLSLSQKRANQPRCPKSQGSQENHSFFPWQKTWCCLSLWTSGCNFLVKRL